MSKANEFRRPTPEEIGRLVRAFRDALEMKQITLAHNAGISERQVQRVEAGESVADETLIRIAKAFGYENDAFTKPRDVMSDEAAAAYEGGLRVVDAKRLRSERDCADLFDHHGFIPDTSRVLEDGLEPVAEFLDMLTDWANIIGDLSLREQLDAWRSLHRQVQVVSAVGYDVVYATYLSDDRFNVLVVTFFSHLDERAKQVQQLVVPRVLLPALSQKPNGSSAPSSPPTPA